MTNLQFNTIINKRIWIWQSCFHHWKKENWESKKKFPVKQVRIARLYNLTILTFSNFWVYNSQFSEFRKIQNKHKCENFFQNCEIFTCISVFFSLEKSVDLHFLKINLKKWDINAVMMSYKVKIVRSKYNYEKKSLNYLFFIFFLFLRWLKCSAFS